MNLYGSSIKSAIKNFFDNFMLKKHYIIKYDTVILLYLLPLNPKRYAAIWKPPAIDTRVQGKKYLTAYCHPRHSRACQNITIPAEASKFRMQPSYHR